MNGVNAGRFPYAGGCLVRTDGLNFKTLSWVCFKRGVETHHNISQEAGSHVDLETAVDDVPAELVQGHLEIYRGKSRSRGDLGLTLKMAGGRAWASKRYF